jgi:hypothetical protein
MQNRTALRALMASAALAAAVTLAAPASALTITLYPNDQPLPVGQTMIDDFDNAIAAGFTFTQNANAYVRSGALGLDNGVSAPPPGDVTNYETVLSNGLATLATSGLLTSFSFYLGSPDAYNTVTFYGLGGYQQTLSGAAILGAAVNADGDQGVGRRVSYDFGTERVNRIVFASSGNSFEFDSLAGTVQAAVPEPATWGMMILGFGGIGALIRRRRATPAALAV